MLAASPASPADQRATRRDGNAVLAVLASPPVSSVDTAGGDTEKLHQDSPATPPRPQNFQPTPTRG